VPDFVVFRANVAKRDADGLDELDRKIVAVLRSGGRPSNSVVGRKVGVSEATARRRIAELERVGALRFVAMTNPHFVGLHVDTLMQLNTDPDKVNEIATKLAEMAEVRFVGIAMGDYDVLVGALFPSSQAWLEFRTNRLAPMEGVRAIHTFQIVKVLKRTYDLLIVHSDGQQVAS
jgi:Lrp/AsnC family transcriptional regulator for asnA, asnC and gidA